MFRLSHVSPDQASGQVAEVYNLFPAGVPKPLPLQMYSASPGLMSAQGEVIKHYLSHQNISFHLLALIRFLVSCHEKYEFCTKFNGEILKQSGMSGEDLAAIQKDPTKAPIEDNERALLAFVMKAVKEPGSVNDEDISALKDMGWPESDIFDAVFLGTTMVANRILTTVFMK
jgi:hypothetical protein